MKTKGQLNVKTPAEHIGAVDDKLEAVRHVVSHHASSRTARARVRGRRRVAETVALLSSALRE